MSAMSAVVSRRHGLRVLLVAGAVTFAPVLLAGPSHAATSTPTPISSEPAGGATCLPGTSATCGQDSGSAPSATPTPKSTSTVTSLPSTGRTPTSLARTGAGAANGWGYAGTGLLVGGSLLVLAARRARRA
jgi:hypothetical protein